MPESSIITIGLLSHSFVSGNLGCGALSIVNANIIGEEALRLGLSPRFHIFGSTDEFDYYECSPYHFDFSNVGYKSLANPRSSLRRNLSKMDVFFEISGGDSFSDQYGWWRFGKIVLTNLVASRTGSPLIFSPQTIGPFISVQARAAARQVLKRAKHIYARDELSFTLLSELGFSNKSRLMTDVAFALEYSDLPRTQPNRDRIRVGLNVSGLLWNTAKGQKLNLDYRALIASVIDKLIAMEECEIHLIPHVYAPHLPEDDDYRVAIHLADLYPRLIKPDPFHSPVAAKTYIASLDLLIGSRMHATIAALSTNTAVLPLGYSRKFTGLFAGLKYPFIVDLRAATAEEALQTLDRLLKDLPRATSLARSANLTAQERLEDYRTSVRNLLASFTAGGAPCAQDGSELAGHVLDP